MERVVGDGAGRPNRLPTAYHQNKMNARPILGSFLLDLVSKQLLLRRTRRPPPRLRSQGAAAPLPAAAPLQQWMQPSPSLLHFVRDSLLALGCRHRLASGQHGALGPDLASVQRGPKVRMQTCSVVLFVLDKRLAPWVLTSLPCRASVGCIAWQRHHRGIFTRCDFSLDL